MLAERQPSYGFEFKFADAPDANRSMRIALDSLAFEHLWIVYPGRREYALDRRITVTPVDSIPRLVATLKK
jgi:hypothetical protein